MTQTVVKRVSLDALGNSLTRLLADLSLSRAQMAYEQIRVLVDSQQLHRLIILAAAESTAVDRPRVAALAVIHPGASRDSVGNIATVIHAGRLDDDAFDLARETRLITGLSITLDAELRRSGIRFSQWATDPIDIDSIDTDPIDSVPAGETKRVVPIDSAPIVVRYCRNFGYQNIAALEYLCGPVANNRGMVSDVDSTKSSRSVHFQPLDWTAPSAVETLIDLVNKTYIDTFDCPQLAEFRSTKDVLESYRNTAAFAPDLWFTVYDHAGSPVGCTILGVHPRCEDDSSQRTKQGSERKTTPTRTTTRPSIGAIEIVYMGITPSARGNGYGAAMLEHAFSIAHQSGAEQVLLAVDGKNEPAKAIYRRGGLQPILRESVWVKSFR